MVKKVFLDIETLPPDRDNPQVSDIIAQCTEDDFRKLALNGTCGRLLCIGLIIEEDEKIIHRGLLGRDRSTLRFHLDETRTLRAFWNLVKNFNPQRDLLIGFNILDFDLLFLFQRSVIKQVRPSINISFTRFRSQPVFDVMWEFTRWRQKISLDALAKALGLESSKGDGVDGASVYQHFLSEHFKEIADYCMCDVELTRRIYYRIQFSSIE